MNLDAGTRIGRYEIRDFLGAGGMGEVYLAHDHDLERDVAVKILRDGAEEGSDRVRRFLQEARAASGLHHPNVAHVYDIGSHGDVRFIAMELLAGETLRRRLERGRMPLHETLDIAMQMAAALGAAHKAGIVHRDVKPENVIITPDGYAKVLDFGLAKLRDTRGANADTLLMTEPGVAMGTIGYSAPEQLIGGQITAAADVFSLGVVLYEMVCGQRPFTGATVTEVVSAILSKAHRPVRDLRSDVPPALETVIRKSLAKVVSERYPDASEVFEQLRVISREQPVASDAVSRGSRPKLMLRVAVIAAVIAFVGIGAWMIRRSERRQKATSQIAAAEKLLEQRNLAQAYETALAAWAVLPRDPRVLDVISRSSNRLTIESTPPGATVYLQRFNGPAQRVRMGITPLTIPRLARADYLITLEKKGFAPAVKPVSTLPLYHRGEARLVETPAIRVQLIEASRVPAGMVYVQGGPYRLTGFDRPSDREIRLSDFFIDRREVSNRDYEQFVREGGYRRRELWKHPFSDRGKALTFEQAMVRFRDATGLPGPRGWNSGAPPPGLLDHPVTEITWYEAAAYAAWKGKKLPTVHQWEKAGRHPGTSALASAFPWGFMGEGADVTDRSNFRGKGTMPVDSLPFGASPWGAQHMAGNVSEWCRNSHPPGRSARGGAWNDAIYAFGQTAAYPAFYSAPTLGFRCVSGTQGDEGDFELSPSGFAPVYRAVDDPTFDRYRSRYEYDRSQPLGARVIEIADTADWKRETITYQVAGKTVPAYLYTPKGFRRPLQVIHFAPAGDVVGGWRTLPHSIEISIGPLIRSGRAVFSVELEGFIGRPWPAGFVIPPRSDDEYVDYSAARVIEMRRGLDYLASRPDIDSKVIAFLGPSAGGGPGVLVTALESRYGSVMFVGSGINPGEERYAPAASRINFAPRIKAPKLLLQGRFDEDTPLESHAEPLFRLLREPKRMQIYEGGHVPPPEIAIPALITWLDETLGPVPQ